MSNKELEQRVFDLETKLAYQEASHDALDLQVQKLNMLVEKLELYCAKMSARVQTIEDQGDQGMPKTERPPHY